MNDLTKRELAIIDAGADILENAPGEVSFLHTSLCQCHFPRRQRSERSFVRSDGQASLKLDAGELWDGHKFVEQPLPYGVKPRLVMLYLTTYAIRNRTTLVPVENSLRGFLKALGLATNGGRTGTYKPFKAQVQALAASRLTLGYVNRAGLAVTRSSKPISEFRAWVDVTGGQRSLWPGEIELSDEFYETLKELAVPLDQRAIAALSKSSLDIDIYTWLAHRLHRLPASGQVIHWKSLRSQFGADYSNPANFKSSFLASLRRAMAVYPDAKVDQIFGGLYLRPSSPPIPKTKVVVPFK